MAKGRETHFLTIFTSYYYNSLFISKDTKDIPSNGLLSLREVIYRLFQFKQIRWRKFQVYFSLKSISKPQIDLYSR